MLMMAAMTNTSTGVSGVCVGPILGMGDGGDRGAMARTTTMKRRANHIPPRGGWRHPRPTWTKRTDDDGNKQWTTQ